ALQDAVEHGGWIARPAVPPEETRRSWKEIHAHWREFLPSADSIEAEHSSTSAKVVAIIDHPAGAHIARTLESLWACSQIDRLVILNRSGEKLPYDCIDLVSAEPEAIAAELRSLTEDDVLLIHPGVAVLPEAFAPMLDAL